MTRYRHRIGRLAATALLTTIALLTATVAVGCGNKGDDVEIKAPEQATTAVKAYAEATRTAAGVAAFSHANEDVSPCEGRAGELSNPEEVYYVQGIYQLMVPADEQADALAKVRQAWETDGFTIKDARTVTGGRGKVSAATTDGYSLSLTSGEPPAMVLLVSSPCYRR
jgi:hypothetical protein